MQKQCFIAALALGMSVSGAVHAQVSEGAAVSAQPASAVPPSLEITLVGDDVRAPVLGQKIASWFGSETTTSVSTRAAIEPNLVLTPSEHAGIRVWIWVRNERGVRLFFSVEPAAHAPTRYLVTDVPLERGLDELGEEQLAQVVHFSAVGLWEGSLESTRSEVEQGLPQAATNTPSVAPKPSKAKLLSDTGRLSFRLGAEYGFRGGVGQGLFSRIGGAFGLFELRSTSAVGAMLHIDVAPAGNPQGTPTLELRETSARVGFLFEHRPPWSSHLSSSLQVGPGLDFLSYSSNHDSGSKVLPFIFITFGGRFQIGPVSAFGGFNYVFELEGVKFRAPNYGGQTTTVGPWFIQPGVLFGIYW